MLKISSIYSTILFVLLSTSLLAQPYMFQNPSFEGQPAASVLPPGWSNCGTPGQTPPDTHPAGIFDVEQKAEHGTTYVGMVVRDNETWEAIGQKAPVTLEKSNCYAFNVNLAKSEYYFSYSMAQESNVQFTTKDVVLRVWGGYTECDKKELLYETKPIKHNSWKQYKIEFTPTIDVRYVVFEVFYKTPIIDAYRGNLLIDNVSPIVSCNEKIPENPPLLAINTPATKPKPPTPKEPVKTTPKPAPKPKPVPKEPTILDLDSKEIKKGDIIEIKNLLFMPDSIVPVTASKKVMDEIYYYLRSNKNIKIEVRGHTNGIPSHDYCDKLSTKRAESVANYLLKKGISPSRITAKGYGKREPIATNDNRAGRMKNQRVEIKILSTE